VMLQTIAPSTAGSPAIFVPCPGHPFDAYQNQFVTLE
jgi:hypothetical protein